MTALRQAKAYATWLESKFKEQAARIEALERELAEATAETVYLGPDPNGGPYYASCSALVRGRVEELERENERLMQDYVATQGGIAIDVHLVLTPREVLELADKLPAALQAAGALLSLAGKLEERRAELEAAKA